jgi:hypothetical protein
MSKRKTTDDFITEAKKIYGDKYDYSKVEYINANTKVCIICPEHGEFFTTPHDFLRGHGCPVCGRERTVSARKVTQEEFISRVIEIHGNKYDFSKAVYVNNRTKVDVYCPEHGWFKITPNSLLNGCGCKECGYKKSGKTRLLTPNEFFERCRNTHGYRYQYDESTYENTSSQIRIFCPDHGWFWQNAKDHSEGHGCPKCAVRLSNSENEIYGYVCSLIGEDKVIQRDKTEISPYEIDIYIPSMQIGIEYNGLLWHSDAYSDDVNKQLKKTILCDEKNIRLIQIFEDEYITHKNIVLSKIRHILGCDNKDKPSVFARKCTVTEIDKKVAKEFLTINHIQGFVGATVYLGCYYNNILVGVMSFKKENRNSLNWELSRFATNSDYRCIGIGGKLFKYFVKHYEFSVIKSFADRRWSKESIDNLYSKLGFTFYGYTNPDYRYITSKRERLHKFRFRKDRLHKKYGVDINDSEREITKKLGFHRIYDCGLIKYIYKNKNGD